MLQNISLRRPCYHRIVLRFSVVSRALAIFIAIALICAPVCPVGHCARSCCPPSSTHCGSNLDFHVDCLRTSALTTVKATPSFLAAVSFLPVTVLSKRTGPFLLRSSQVRSHFPAPPLSLRI